MLSQHNSHPQKCVGIGVLFIVGGLLSCMVASVLGDDYLQEAPKFLKPCALSDPKNGVCIANAVENVFTHWKNGVPGLKNLGGIDPFNIKKVHLEQNNPNINLKIDLKDIIVAGLSQTKATKASINDEYNIKILVKMPSLHSKGHYRMKGNVLFLSLDSVGVMETEASNVDVLFSLKTNLIKSNGQKFFDVTGVQSSVKNIGGFRTHFDNLFNGNTELEQSANDVFNQNWRDIFEILRPVIEETLDAVAFDRYKKILNYVPASYFFVDLP